MNLLRKIINSTYGMRMKFSKLTGMGFHVIENKNLIKAYQSFYSLSATLTTGEQISFERYRNKKLLLVNTASLCGYTPQYKQLELLHQSEKDLIILGFPSNNFGGQEPDSDENIAQFCKTNYHITFPLFRKNDVTGVSKQPVYEWLTNKDKNGWNDLEPQWNFYKYLIDENGNLIRVFSSAVSPLDIVL